MAQSRRAPGGEPAPARPGLEVQRAELVGAQHPAVDRRIVVQGEDAGHLLGELRVTAGLPRLGRLPPDPGLAQDLADRLGTDGDVFVLGQVLDQLRQAPRRERAAKLLRRGLGDPAHGLTNRGAEPRWPAPAPFWVQRREPGLVERVDHLPRILRLHREHARRFRRTPALRRGQHDPRPAQPHPILRGPRDLHQPLCLLRFQRPHEHLRLSSHHHLRQQASRPTTEPVNPTRLQPQRFLGRH